MILGVNEDNFSWGRRHTKVKSTIKAYTEEMKRVVDEQLTVEVGDRAFYASAV